MRKISFCINSYHLPVHAPMIITRILLICFILLITIAGQSQKRTFIRVFDENGSKIHKGFLSGTSDSSLFILANDKVIEINIDDIGKVKLRRSLGHTILVTSLITGISFAILGAATAEPDAMFFGYTAGEGFLTGLAIGCPTGAIIGGIVAGFKKRPELIVNRSREQWVQIKKILDVYLL